MTTRENALFQEETVNIVTGCAILLCVIVAHPGSRGLQIRHIICSWIEANPRNRGLQIRHIICSWIEAKQSKATVRALLEGLWQSDDTKVLACVEDMYSEVGEGMIPPRLYNSV